MEENWCRAPAADLWKKGNDNWTFFLILWMLIAEDLPKFLDWTKVLLEGMSLSCGQRAYSGVLLFFFFEKKPAVQEHLPFKKSKWVYYSVFHLVSGSQRIGKLNYMEPCPEWFFAKSDCLEIQPLEATLLVVNVGRSLLREKEVLKAPFGILSRTHGSFLLFRAQKHTWVRTEGCKYWINSTRIELIPSALFYALSISDHFEKRHSKWNRMFLQFCTNSWIWPQVWYWVPLTATLLATLYSTQAFHLFFRQTETANCLSDLPHDIVFTR